MRRGHAHSLSFERAIALTLVAAGAAAVVVGCGSISVVSDGGSGTGGKIDITSGTGGAGTGGHTGAGGSGAGGKVAGTGGATGSGGATGTGGMIAGTGGTTGSGGATGTGGMTGTGGTIDAGVDRGCICPTVIALVCGSDGMTYNNSCLAGCAGVTVAHTGACVVACTAVRGCCSDDSDCGANQECAGTLCGADGRANGVCKARPARGRCWTDADCAAQNPNNNNCTNAVVCPCNMVCVRADMLGTCN